MKLLTFCPIADVSQDSGLALVLNLQQATSPLVPQLMETTLGLLLYELEHIMEVSQPEVTYWSFTVALRDKVEAATADIGQKLTNAVATCFGPNVDVFQLQICTSVSKILVNTMHENFLLQFQTFPLIDSDESFSIAGEPVIGAIQEMTRGRGK